MIIDRIIENGLNLVHPGTVVTSPVYLGSFYQDTSPATEINNSLCAPNEFDGWGKVGSPTPPTADSATNECCMSEVRSFGRFQGVRVKNTVKELIMQKRLSNQNVQQHSEGEYTELTSLLQGHKRTADFSLITDSPAKRLATAKAILSLSPPEGSTLDIDFMELGYESMKSETSPQETLPDYFSHIDYQSLYPQTHMPQAMGNSYVPQPFIAPLTQKGVWPLAQFAEGEPTSFFQWQIRQEEEKLAGLTPEMLTSQDNDGDTSVCVVFINPLYTFAFCRSKQLCILDSVNFLTQWPPTLVLGRYGCAGFCSSLAQCLNTNLPHPVALQEQGC